MADDFPYRVEYSKSNRASCKVCKSLIAKDTLRIATIVQSPFHDGKLERWHHASCFFTKQRPNSTDVIGHFDNIRWEDQEFIKKKIAEASGAQSTSTGKASRKRGKESKGCNDFSVQYAKSNRSKCKGCEETIAKGEIRVGKKDYESEEARKFGGLDRWHHLECFVKMRSELEFFEQGDQIPGTTYLSKEDKELLKTSLPKVKQEDMPPAAKRVKNEPTDTEEEKEMKAQNKKLFSIRDHLKVLAKSELTKLLERNKQYIPTGNAEILDHLADNMIFGALEKCKECSGLLMYESGRGYKCKSSLNEWAQCEFVTQDPKRKNFVVPSDLKEKYDFLAAYKCKVKRRLIKVTAPAYSPFVKKEDDTTDGPKVQGPPRPLKHLEFVVIGKLKRNKDALTKEIIQLGGALKTKLNENTTAVISTKEEVEKMSKKMKEAQERGIGIITEDFLDEAKEYSDTPIILIKKKTISPWGEDPSSRINKSVAQKSVPKSKSKYEKSVSGKVTLKIKGGGAVDPDSGIDDIAQVYQRGKEKFTVTLGNTDIQTQKNSYYKLQILKHDHREKYWLFRSWGRIGTTIGGNKLEDLSKEDCIEMFESLYLEKTGNMWENRNNFKKQPRLMYPIEIDHGEDEDAAKLLDSEIESKLKKPVQDLIRMIFDVNSMKKALLEYEIDMDKMPLGKLSKNQIQSAYAVLTELLTLLKTGNPPRTALISASNKFYTLIPHNFGVSGPNIIDSEAEIQAKSQMLESLLEMEIAYNLLHSSTDKNKNPLDAHYEQLKTDIDVLDKDSKEYKMIEKYVKNTHAETHRQYELEIQDVFAIKRKAESSRYKPYKNFENRKLLWHGSRTTNYAGILSQGLRIAPPEAPVTGYMFGKGIYFADMVSKSANYCCTSTQNPTGLLMLCEVALGNMYECLNAEYIEKLPKGKHSTWGRGRTMPDPEKSLKLKSGLEVPYGPGIPVELPKKSSLLYNEFIVYDVAQVKVEYLVKTNFKYKY